jgi:hypothetical protein
LESAYNEGLVPVLRSGFHSHLDLPIQYHNHFFDEGGAGTLLPRSNFPMFHVPRPDCPCDIVDTFSMIYSALRPHVIAIASAGDVALISGIAGLRRRPSHFHTLCLFCMENQE